MNIIVAQLENGVIGVDNDLPWRNVLTCGDIAHKDMELFKQYTKAANLVMGWNTWVSLNKKPLKGRGIHYIITSKNIEMDPYSNIRYLTLDSFIKILPSIDTDNLWCIGGATLYKALEKYCETLYVSVLKPAIPIKLDSRDLTYYHIDLTGKKPNDAYVFPATGNVLEQYFVKQEKFLNPQH